MQHVTFLLPFALLLFVSQTVRMVVSKYRRMEVISFIIMVALIVACGVLGLFYK